MGHRGDVDVLALRLWLDKAASGAFLSSLDMAVAHGKGPQRLPEARNRAPLSLKMESLHGRDIVLFLPRTFHGQLHVKQLTEGNSSSLTGSKVFRTNDAPMISKEIRDASLSVQATDYEVLCEIRPTECHHQLGKDVAEVVAPCGRVHVKYESQTWKDTRAARARSVKWGKSEKKEPVECQ